MMPLLIQTLRSRWFAVSVHAGLWLLLFLAVSKFGGKAPIYKDSVALTTPAQSPVPVVKLERLSAPGLWPSILTDTNASTLFFTKHFIPPPTPASPAPTTKKVDITYLGFYDAEGSPRRVFVKLAEMIEVKPVGVRITTNWFIGQAAFKSLSLTNLAAQSTVLPLNEKKQIEVPIQ
jgi:hypothetical protein